MNKTIKMLSLTILMLSSSTASDEHSESLDVDSFLIVEMKEAFDDESFTFISDSDETINESTSEEEESSSDDIQLIRYVALNDSVALTPSQKLTRYRIGFWLASDFYHMSPFQCSWRVLVTAAWPTSFFQMIARNRYALLLDENNKITGFETVEHLNGKPNMRIKNENPIVSVSSSSRVDWNYLVSYCVYGSLINVIDFFDNTWKKITG